MSHTTTCTVCGGAYDASSEETANYPGDRICPMCQQAPRAERPQTFKAEIIAAHPESAGRNEKTKEESRRRYERWELAMKLVGERHEKAGLVRLVNWLLVDRERLDRLQKHGNRMIGWIIEWNEKGQAGLMLHQRAGWTDEKIRAAIDRFFADVDLRFQQCQPKDDRHCESCCPEFSCWKAGDFCRHPEAKGSP